MTIITFVLVLLMADGRVVTDARQVPDEQACEDRKAAAIDAVQISRDVIDAGVSCFKTEFSPTFKPRA